MKPLGTAAGIMMATWSLTLGAATAWPADPNVDGAIRLLSKSVTRDEERAQVDDIVARASKDSPFRAELARLLMERLSSQTDLRRAFGEIQALGLLRATEAAPTLSQLWENRSKSGVDSCTLVRALALPLSDEKRSEFLITVMDDETETMRVRLHAQLGAAAAGDQEAIHHALGLYDKYCKRYPRTMYLGKPPRPPVQQPRDGDDDGLSDYTEQGVFLDPAKPDTDGDGTPDSNDRNPLTAQKQELSENQRIAMLLFHQYQVYIGGWSAQPAHKIPKWFGPSEGICIAETTDQHWNGNEGPGLLAGMEIIGVNNIVLAMTPDQIRQYDILHGRNHTRRIHIACVNDTKREDSRQRWLRHLNMTETDKDRMFHLSESLPGTGHTWLIRVRKSGDAWLPIEWMPDMTT